jgi:hypothetical protein
LVLTLSAEQARPDGSLMRSQLRLVELGAEDRRSLRHLERCLTGLTLREARVSGPATHPRPLLSSSGPTAEDQNCRWAGRARCWEAGLVLARIFIASPPY